MNDLNDKLQLLKNKLDSGKLVKIAILGLGSVGNYLLNYLNSWNFQNIEIYIGARNVDKAIKDINISKVAAIIRNDKTKNIFIHEVNLNDVQSISDFIKNIEPDFIVNSSRVYSGLKYGSISWHTIRAYGLWTPLSVRFIRNIMKAHELVDSKAIVINTSYSDAVIPWLKSAGMRYPDFGSGNLNHLIPRIKLAVARNMNINDIENIEICMATSHFHDVVISKEGQTENCEPLINISYKGENLKLNMQKIWKDCAIEMPTDAKRNMMNASSNFEIIKKIIMSARNNSAALIHSPGVNGFIGGYPIIVDYSDKCICKFDERYFTLNDMLSCNKKSIYLDGIEKVENGNLFYTDELINKVKNSFGVVVSKIVKFSDIEKTAEFIIEKIINPNMRSK